MARSSFIYQPPLYIIVTSSWQERHSDKKNGQIWLVRCNWETMVQFMEAAKRAIATLRFSYYVICAHLWLGLTFELKFELGLLWSWV